MSGSEAAVPDARSSNRATTLLFALIVALWAVWTLPLVTGDRQLVLRDTLRLHAPYKAFGASALREGSIPAVNPTWGLGQPFRGNPNTLAFYPSNLLYLALPFWSAFHLHYALHWLLGFLGMRALARALGQSEPAALLAAVAWAGSGYFLSLLSFYNLVAVGGWAPWILFGLVRGGRRGIALAALALGLALLAGEPVTTALLLPAMLVAASERRASSGASDRSRFAGVVVATLLAAAGAALVALPQLVATARVAGFLRRVAVGLTPGESATEALAPLRFLELVVPLPWGWPSDLSRFDFWSQAATPNPPYVHSLHVGVVAAALALVAIAIRRRWAALAVVSLALAWAGGLSGEVTRAVTFGFFRYPQKALVLFALAAPLLAGWGLDRLLAAPSTRGARRALAIAGAALLALALVLALAREPFVAALAELASPGMERFAARAAAVWTVGFAVAGLLLAASGWALARRRATLVVGIELAGLLGLAPTLLADRGAPYRETPALGGALEPDSSRGRRILPVPYFLTSWEPLDSTPAPLTVTDATRLSFEALDPGWGVLHGVRYPLLPDVESFGSPLTGLVVDRIGAMSWPSRLEWLRRFGVDAVVRLSRAPVPGLTRLATVERAGLPIGLDRVERVAPAVYWPQTLEVASNPLEAYRRITAGEISESAALASRAIEHRAGAAVTLVRELPDRITIDVDGGGGLLVVGRAWLPLYRARLDDGTALATQPVDLALLGIEVPAGRRRVEIAISSAPERFAGALALIAGTALAFAAWRREPAGAHLSGRGT